MDNSRFHISLRQLRESKGMSQEALADELGVSRQAVGHWESGRMQPQLCLAIKIAKIFGTTVEEMMIVKEESRPLTKQFLSQFDHENENLGMR